MARRSVGRDALAQLRSVAGEKGYHLERAPIRDCWFLIDERTGKPAVSDRGTTAFTIDRAIKFLSRGPTVTKKPPHLGG